MWMNGQLGLVIFVGRSAKPVTPEKDVARAEGSRLSLRASAARTLVSALLRLSGIEEIKRWLPSFGRYEFMLAPPSLLEEMIAESRAASAAYGEAAGHGVNCR